MNKELKAGKSYRMRKMSGAGDETVAEWSVETSEQRMQEMPLTLGQITHAFLDLLLTIWPEQRGRDELYMTLPRLTVTEDIVRPDVIVTMQEEHIHDEWIVPMDYYTLPLREFVTRFLTEPAGLLASYVRDWRIAHYRELPISADVHQARHTDPRTGLSVRLMQGYSIQQNAQVMRADIALVRQL